MLIRPFVDHMTRDKQSQSLITLSLPHPHHQNRCPGQKCGLHFTLSTLSAQTKATSTTLAARSLGTSVCHIPASAYLEPRWKEGGMGAHLSHPPAFLSSLTYYTTTASEFRYPSSMFSPPQANQRRLLFCNEKSKYQRGAGFELILTAQT